MSPLPLAFTPHGYNMAAPASGQQFTQKDAAKTEKIEGST